MESDDKPAREFDLAELRKITDTIFDHLIGDLGIQRVSIEPDRDFYWDVPTSKLADMSDPHPTLDVGRLSDDWCFLRGILTDKDEAVALMLIHVAPLLRYLGEKVQR